MKTVGLPLLLAAKAMLVAGYSTNNHLVPDAVQKPPTVDRRGWFGGVATAVTSAVAVSVPSMASADTTTSKLKTFEDPKNGFSVGVPADWVEAVRALPDRRTIRFWSDPEDSQTFVFIAYTPVRDDFTSLGSFGSVETVADQTILPKGELMGVEVESKMLSAVSEKQAYVFDYQQSVPNVQPMTHFRTIFTLQQGATGGAGSMLVSITAQTPEARYEALKPMFDDIVNSYAKMKMVA
mmetsp:Transcript_10759/g.20726  ORF Transcript_10759/g.20726 Transcript_10759/m.20726 type:complete len:237 (-) Transcript_10759:177-887(-)|eukprot:scaffold2372_cov158-Amphora_coffeaeformis.AAC.5